MKRKYKVTAEVILELPDDLLDATDEDRECSAERLVEHALEEMSLPDGGKVIKVFTNGYMIHGDKKDKQ